MAKHLFVAGNVVVSKDKGIAITSFGLVLKNLGNVTFLKKPFCSDVYTDVICHAI